MNFHRMLPLNNIMKPNRQNDTLDDAWNNAWNNARNDARNDAWNDAPNDARNDAWNDARYDARNDARENKMQPSVKRQDSHFGKMSSSSPFPKLPTGTTSGHKVTRNSFRGQGLYFGGLYFVDRGKMLPFSNAAAN